MSTIKEIASSYIQFLEKGEIQKVINLFSPNGMVHPPIDDQNRKRFLYRTQ